VSSAIETELKLSLEAAQAERLWDHPLIGTAARGTPQCQSLYSIYYDTPGLDLLHAGIALRVRRLSERWIQTLKTAGEERAGLHQRAEWEAEVATSVPELDKIDHPELRAQLLDKDLQPLFVTEFERTLVQLHFDDDSLVELALDRGEIKSGDISLPLCELELELKSGSPIKLYDLALALLDQVPARIESSSKAERGYRLLSPQRARPHKAKAAGLAAKMGVEQGFEQVLWSCLAQLQGNEPAVLQEGDKEGIHQMRVALRRLRAAQHLFHPVIPIEASGPLSEEIKWLNDELAAARDWDVLVTETVEPLLQRGALDDTLAELERAAQTYAARSFARACEALRSVRYTRLLLGLGRWLVCRAWREGLGTEPQQRLSLPLVRFAAETLEPLHRKVHKLGRRLTQLTPEQRHRLRIRVKRLRYAGEYIAELYPSKRLRRYLAQLSKLQSALGALNDAAVAERLLQEAGLAQSPARAWVLGWHACKQEMELKTLTAAWKAFTRCKPFWH
jgi:inorganic triphosphatase YgiF